MKPQWVEGDFVGTYVGERAAGATGRGPSNGRRFTLELQSGRTGALRSVRPPADDEPCTSAVPEVRQARVDAISTYAFGKLESRPLFDVRIRDFRLSHPAEANGRSYGTIRGTICARLTPDRIGSFELQPGPEPKPELQREPEFQPESEDESAATATAAEPRSGSEFADFDADAVVARVRWIAIFIVGSLVALALHLRCGGATAMTWAAPVLLGLGLRRGLRRIALQTWDLGFWVGTGLVAYQLYWLFDPIQLAWNAGCKANLEGSLLGLAAPVVLSAALRTRWVLFVTAMLWTCTMFHWCGELAGSCSPQAIAAAHGASNRTDASGRWPAPPTATANLAAPAVPTGADDPNPALLRAGSVEPPDVDGPRGIERLSTDPTLEALASPEPVGSSAGGTVPAGMPATAAPPDPASALARIGPSFGDEPDGLVLISLDFANRNPAAFYDSAIGRRVYLQTDPIFETGSARIRASASTDLTRLAMLMNLRPGRRIALEIHTDTSADPVAQKKLSRQRAGALREWLVARGGVDATQFEVLAAAASRPLVPGGPAAQRSNRRIEARLLN